MTNITEVNVLYVILLNFLHEKNEQRIAGCWPKVNSHIIWIFCNFFFFIFVTNIPALVCKVLYHRIRKFITYSNACINTYRILCNGIFWISFYSPSKDLEDLIRRFSYKNHDVCTTIMYNLLLQIIWKWSNKLIFNQAEIIRRDEYERKKVGNEKKDHYYFKI